MLRPDPLSKHIKRYTMMSLKEIGVEFGMDYAAVSQSCKRLEELVKRDESALRMKTMVEKELRN
jgi:chromosomal replication initiation ATPase DnaA